MILLRKQTVFIKGWFSLLINIDCNALFSADHLVGNLQVQGENRLNPFQHLPCYSNVSCYLLFVTGNFRVIWSGPEIFHHNLS